MLDGECEREMVLVLRGGSYPLREALDEATYLCSWEEGSRGGLLDKRGLLLTIGEFTISSTRLKKIRRLEVKNH